MFFPKNTVDNVSLVIFLSEKYAKKLLKWLDGIYVAKKVTIFFYICTAINIKCSLT